MDISIYGKPRCEMATLLNYLYQMIYIYKKKKNFFFLFKSYKVNYICIYMEIFKKKRKKENYIINILIY